VALATTLLALNISLKTFSLRVLLYCVGADVKPYSINSQSTSAHSALGTLAITDMYYTNPRFTYLLTNVVVWLGILHISEVALQ